MNDEQLFLPTGPKNFDPIFFEENFMGNADFTTLVLLGDSEADLITFHDCPSLSCVL